MLILVVEDDRRVADFLVRGLQEEEHTVDLCTDGASALTQALNQPYDVIIMDWNLPAGDGVSVVRKLRAAGCSTAVLMLTARSGVDGTILALDAGADDYLTKPFHFSELLARLRALERRAARSDAPVGTISIGLATVDLRARTVRHSSGPEESLSTREFALLDLLIRERGDVVTRTRILDRVWGVHYETSTNVLDVYIRYLRQKLDPPDADSSCIETVRGRGYRLRPQHELNPA